MKQLSTFQRPRSQRVQTPGDPQDDVVSAGISAVVFGSRDQLCIHPRVTGENGKSDMAPSSGDKVKMCNLLVKAKQCEFYNNYSKADVSSSSSSSSKIRSSFVEDSLIADIEDLVVSNKRQRVCPYYAAKELSGAVNLVLLPYNYLLDKTIRKSLSVNLNGSVVIFDEAHNIMKTCEDAASMAFESQDVAVAIHETDIIIEYLSANQEAFSEVESNNSKSIDVSLEDVCIVKESLVSFEKTIIQFFGEMKLRVGVTLNGYVLQEALAASGINAGNQEGYCKIMQKILDVVALIQSMGGKTVSGKGVNAMIKVLQTIFITSFHSLSMMPIENNFQLCDGSHLKEYYRLFITKKVKSGNFAEKNSDTNGGVDNYQFNLWCFHPGFAMKSLLECGVKSIVLASGTLKPLTSFAKELDLNFEVQMSAGHVIDPSQCLVVAFDKGKDEKTEFLATYQNRGNEAYMRSLGVAFKEICSRIPDGCLLFFPSYSLMESVTSFWKSIGLWENIALDTALFIEPKSKFDF